MKKILITLSIILLATTAHAERWIECISTTIGSVTYENPRRREGDCLSLGFCSGPNNTGLSTNVFEAQGNEWNDAAQSNKKCDRAAPVGSRIIDLTAQEVQDIADALANQQDSALRNGAKSQFDGQNVTGLQLRAIIELIVQQINALRTDVDEMTKETNQLTDRNRPPFTRSQVINAIKTAIDDGSVDQ